MKKIVFIASGFIFFGLASTVFAQGFVPLAPIPGLTDPTTANTPGFANFFNNLYKYLIGLSAILAIIMIIWGGLEYSTQDIPSAKQNGKDRIFQALFGLVLVLAPVLVFSIINPKILNLSLNLKPLDTVFATPPGGGGGGPVVDSATGCTVTGTAGILQIATCPTPQRAAVWGQGCTNGALAFAQITNPVNGIVTNVITCSVQKNYVFIDTSDLLRVSIINNMRPLVRTATNPNNGSDAMQFASICGGVNLGLQTCVSDDPDFSFSVPCNLTGANAATSWKCYDEKLICKDAATVNIYCATSPNWTPFE